MRLRPHAIALSGLDIAGRLLSDKTSGFRFVVDADFLSVGLA